jgi:DnaJ-domain-containing protein 1
MSDRNRYPLSWPLGWVRTEPRARRRAAFRDHGQALSVWSAIVRLDRELRLLRATDELLSSNVALRRDGRPRSDQAEPENPGAAVYFRLKKQDRCLACDRWDRVADNIAAIAQHIDALRRIERYGVGTIEQAFAGYAALPSGVEQWWDVLGVSPRASSVEVEEAYRRLSKVLHPDVGGSPEAMARLNAARDAARKALA